jgi:hypothetical protein
MGGLCRKRRGRTEGYIDASLCDYRKRSAVGP